MRICVLDQKEAVWRRLRRFGWVGGATSKNGALCKLSRTVCHCKYWLNQLSKKTLLMMAKHWQPGRVKTRLAATIGALAAAELHRVFVRQLATRLATCSDQRRVLTSPDDCCGALAAEIDPLWAVFPQGNGDLGRRMWRGFRRELAGDGPSAIVMIGADLPTLTTADIEAAFAALASHDGVLGPAFDGGYYLIGLRGTIAHRNAARANNGRLDSAAAGRLQNLFVDIDWGTPAVLDQTLARGRQNALKLSLLEQREDIDTKVELGRLLQHLRQATSPDDVALAEQVDEVLQRHRLDHLFPA